MTKRRSLTPSAGLPPVVPGTHAMRRGTVRREVTERVTLRSPGGELLEGWALNESRGGLRAIVEASDHGGKVELGVEYELVIGSASPPRRARAVWLQEEPDGMVVGLEYVSLSGLHRAAPPTAPPGATELASDASRADGAASAAEDADREKR